MDGVLLGIVIVCGLVWAGISLSQKLTGDKHQRAARESQAAGDWEQAALSYKLAIISRLDAEPKLREYTEELAAVYASQSLECDLSQVLECPRVIRTLGADTANQKRKNELLVKLYQETSEFLDGLPGPAIPDD